MRIQENFSLNVVLRVLLLAFTALGLAWVITNTSWFFTPLVIGIFFLLLVSNLIFYVERSNRNLSQFLLSVKQQGFTNLFKDKSHGGTHGELNEIFNEILLQFQKITLEKESHYQYLQTLNENLGVSLLSFGSEGKIELMNPAVKQLLNKPFLKTIKDLEHVNPELFKTINVLESDEKRVIKTIINGELLQLSVQVKDFITANKKFRLVLIQNIHNELEAKEVEAWQKLISVLTHEIMNSVTPIASLSSALNEQLQAGDLPMNREDTEDLKLSIATIENRSKGLMKFVNAYKDFTKKPEVILTDIDLNTLVDRIVQLLSPDIQNAGIALVVKTTHGKCDLKADSELIEQVIINIIKNGIEVLGTIKRPQILITINKSGRQRSIRIEDNGPGMESETIEKIFVPFFTTKKKGTGVGLSFARQIMKLHNGTIKVHSELGSGTTFILDF